MHSAILFARAMRSHGYAYVRLSKGHAHFRRVVLIGGRRAHSAVAFTLDYLARLALPIGRLADQCLAQSEASFDRLRAGAA